MKNPMKDPVWDKPLEEITKADELYMNYLSALDNARVAEGVAKTRYKELLKVVPSCPHCNNRHYPHCEISK